MDSNELNRGCSMEEFIQRAWDSLERRAPMSEEEEGAASIYDPSTWDELITGFVLRRHELRELVKYSIREEISSEFLQFQFTGDNFDNFAERADEILKVLGEQERFVLVNEVFLEAALDYPIHHWRVFRYGTPEEKRAYKEKGGGDFQHSEPGVAESMASKVVDRVFREGAPLEQRVLLDAELRRYSATLCSYVGPAPIVWTMQIGFFEIDFPVELKPFVVSTGINELDPDPDHCSFLEASLEQGKAILLALDKVARKGEDALKALVQERSAGRMKTWNFSASDYVTPPSVIRAARAINGAKLEPDVHS